MLKPSKNVAAIRGEGAEARLASDIANAVNGAIERGLNPLGVVQTLLATSAGMFANNIVPPPRLEVWFEWLAVTVNMIKKARDTNNG